METFQPDPEGKSISAAANLAGVEGALSKLEKAEKLLAKARMHPNRISTNTEAEIEYNEAHQRVGWWLWKRTNR